MANLQQHQQSLKQNALFSRTLTKAIFLARYPADFSMTFYIIVRILQKLIIIVSRPFSTQKRGLDDTNKLKLKVFMLDLILAKKYSKTECSSGSVAVASLSLQS